jgi:hypothetical protein
MEFNEFMALILPSLISLFLYSKINKRKLPLLEAIGFGALCMLVINSVCYAILIYFLNTTVFLFTPVFTLKYCILATVLALCMVVFYRFIEMNMKIKLKVESLYEEE